MNLLRTWYELSSSTDNIELNLANASTHLASCARVEGARFGLEPRVDIVLGAAAVVPLSTRRCTTLGQNSKVNVVSRIFKY